jgi:hypothetical protein
VDLLGKINFPAVSKGKWFVDGLAIATDCLKLVGAEMHWFCVHAHA